MAVSFDLKKEEIIRFSPWPCEDVSPKEEGPMEFRLIYRGKLPSATGGHTRAREKHEIRRYLHPQLGELWRRIPLLKSYVERTGEPPEDGVPQPLARIANKYARCGFKFVPLIEENQGLACRLDILFLRRDEPGRIVHGGDIDNRIKVLFDALRVPKNCDEVFGQPTADENPFHCLLEDDVLITELHVSTDRLLTPAADNEFQNDVHLVIHVQTIVTNRNDLSALMF